jgi:DNA repair exonuclease SbcCD ATPase subunit
MRIASIEFLNWLCFRGEHELTLEAKSYGVFARHEDNPDISNWNGKTALLEGINFALHGGHRHRTEDEWITHGETEGHVRLIFDDGTVVTRSRVKGKRTQLVYVGALAEKGALQDEAQALVKQTIGMDEQDFLNTCYFQQRQMAHIILARPEERMGIVSGWLRLGPLEACADDVAAQSSELLGEIERLENQIKTLEDLRTNTLAGATSEELETTALNSEHLMAKVRKQLDQATTAMEENAKKLAAQTLVRDFESLVAEGKAVRASVDAADGVALQKQHEAFRAAELALNGKLRMAQTAAYEARKVAQGEFDGKCPVAGIACPAKDEINADRKRSLKLYNETATTASDLADEVNEAQRAEQRARAALQEHERKVAKLEALRAQAAKLEGAYEAALTCDAPEDPSTLRTRLDNARVRHEEVKQNWNSAKARIDQLAQIKAKREGLDERMVALRAKVALTREALIVFGKQGAQRKVAEGALNVFEQDANASLRESGIDLSIGVRWSREGSSPARACDVCGSPFPASAKVKVCMRCQAARGLQQVNKLEFIMSDKSGAAEDLAGINVTLAASVWLRRERGSTWETVMLDEPYGQLDVHNRKAMGRHLAALLAGRYGFTQAFVVAHSPDVLEALPGRLEVVRRGKGSTIQVVA